MFIDVLDSLCKANNTTVTAVCKELGLSTSKPTSWRNGSTPNAKYVIMFAKYFNVSTDYLLEMGQYDVSPEKAALINEIKDMTDEQVALLVRLAKSLLSP